jgi:hypothetical protein
LLEAPPGRFDDALPRGLLLVLAVAHAQPLAEPLFSVTQVTPLSYDRTIALRS